MPDTRETEVAIVGAGLAGLAAARRLTASGIDCVLLEARDRVGGRTLNHPIGDGKIVEVGGQWVGPTQTRVLELIRELGLESFPTYNRGEHVIEYDGALHRYTGTIPRISKRLLADFGQAQWRLDRMAKKVPAEAPWTASKAKEWDSQTLWSWMRRNVVTKGARDALSLGVEAVWAAQPEDISLLHALFYISSAGGLDALWDTEGGAQDARVVGGTQLISIRMAEELGDRVVLEAPVRRIAYGEADRVTVHADGLDVEARRVIVAMPPTLTCRIAYDPPMPALRDQLTQRIPQGTVIKCMAIYDRPFWRARGLTGQATSTDGPVKLTFDNSPPDGAPGVLLGFLEGTQARELGAWEPARRRAAVIDCFARLFGDEARAALDYVDKSWADEEWTRGCYGCYMPTGAWTAYGPQLRAPVGPIHWAGAETATVWSGYMDGAVRSGDTAADTVAASLSGARERFAAA
ncbi:MAG TPA: flavin monoamine oxidase family protein [Thermoleophilaceae bacterium]|nr:flavin monoamine oxidase family protein [Thermoleophilaceae bacterium]